MFGSVSLTVCVFVCLFFPVQSDLWSLGITALEMAEGAPRKSGTHTLSLQLERLFRPWTIWLSVSELVSCNAIPKVLKFKRIKFESSVQFFL